MIEEIEIKTERLCRMMADSQLDGLILNAQHNFAWLTCGGSNGIDASREQGVASIFVTREGRRYILANNIEISRLFAEQVDSDEFEPVKYSWQQEKANGGLALAKARQIAGTEANVAVDLPGYPEAMMIEQKVAPCRFQLTTHEQERFRKLGRDAGDAMTFAAKNASPGNTEHEIAEILRHEMGIKGIVPVVVLIGADERISRYRHPLPTSRKWKRLLLLVVCAKRGGLIVSLSRMVCAGRVSPELEARMNAAGFVFASLLNATRPDTTGADLYLAAERAYADVGFANEIDKHHQGGAAGYRTREWVAHPGSTDTVMNGHAFAWNPSITGTKIEDTILLADNVIENITITPDWPAIRSTVNGCDYLSHGILSLEA